MKNIRTLTILSIAVAATVLSCNSSDDNTNTENLEAAAGMTASLARMASENDSLVIHHTGHMYHHHDSIFHHEDSVFVHHHHDYHGNDTIHHSGDHHNEDQHHHHDSIVASHHNIAH